MIRENFKTVVFTLLICNVIFLASCEKQKITFKGSVPEEVVLPDKCEACHNATFPGHSTNAHSKHTIGLYAYDCNECHFGHGYETVTHIDAVKNVTFDPAGLATRKGSDSNTPTWDSNSKTCSNVYCHSNGVTADRGTDGTYTWGDTTALPFGTTVYAQTPRWDTGKITECAFCHNGIGNMTSPYFITKDIIMTAGKYPASGSHQLNAHMSNTKDFSLAPYSTPYWSGVQCFWCHTASATDVTSVNGPILQGTYGTNYHIDGETFFKPLNVSAGGTMANGMSYSFNGAAAHCGDGKKCW